MSATRKRYVARLVGRCLIFIACVCLWVFRPQAFDVLEGNNFFRRLSPLHLLWVIWAADMFLQIVPIKNKVPLGSQKLFANRFRPIREKINYEALRNYITATTRSAYKVFILWCLLIAAIGLLHRFGVIDRTALFMISVLFYVCDLICVLIWCPFRLIMKNPLLHHLPHLQLGPSHDVLAAYLHGRLLRRLAGRHGNSGLAGLGAVRHDVPGALLGPRQRGAQVLGVHG